MNKYIYIIFFSASLVMVNSVYGVNVVISSSDSKETVNIDSFVEGEKLYIHLPTLIMKINGIISIQGKEVKFEVNNKSVNIDLQSNLASIYDGISSKLIQFQNPTKVWQDTLWLELNDAKTLVQYVVDKKLETETEPLKTDETGNPSELNSPNIVAPNDNKSEIEMNNFEQIQETAQLEKDIIKNDEENKKKLTLTKVFIDPGHGGDDTGILFLSGKYEKEITINFAKKIETQMKKNGIETILGRQEDTPLTIKDRCNYMLKEKVDYFISIHTESPKREKVGMRLFISQFKSDKLNQINGSLADLIIESLKAKQKELVVERIDSPLLISDNTNIPGILIEIFPTYKNNSEEEDWDILLDKKSTIADTIAESLNKYRINMEKSQKNE